LSFDGQDGGQEIQKIWNRDERDGKTEIPYSKFQTTPFPWPLDLGFWIKVVIPFIPFIPVKPALTAFR
jgi:hypothetical protein